MAKTSLSELGESGLLRYIERNLRFPKDKRLLLGPGDDCAVLKVSPGKKLVITTDELVENTHFLRVFAAPESLAVKLLQINLSDLASMGSVRPVSCLVGAGLPKDLPADFALRFIKTLKKEALKYGISIAGGNLSGAGEIHLYMTVWGEADAKKIVTRYGARAGDLLFTLGPLGLARAGLEILRTRNAEAEQRFKGLVKAFWAPKAFLTEGAVLGEKKLATAMLDNSDGLYRSVKIISELSRCRVRVKLSDALLSPELAKYAMQKKKKWQEYALNGGEDYGLIFTAAPRHAALIKKILPNSSEIGSIEPGKGVEIEGYDGETESYSHF